MISPHPPRCARPPLPQCAGLSGENFPAIDTCAGLHGNELTPSCADLIRASTPLYRPPQGVDAHGSSPWAEGPRVEMLWGWAAAALDILSVVQHQHRQTGAIRCQSSSTRTTPWPPLITIARWWAHWN